MNATPPLIEDRDAEVRAIANYKRIVELFPDAYSLGYGAASSCPEDGPPRPEGYFGWTDDKRRAWHHGILDGFQALGSKQQ